MNSIIRKTFICLFALSFISLTSNAQTTHKVEPTKEKTNKIEIKTEKEIKDANVIKVSDDKVNTNAKSHYCKHSKECKDEKDKSTTMNSKDCCKDKSTTMNSKDCCKNKNKDKCGHEVKPETK